MLLILAPSASSWSEKPKSTLGLLFELPHRAGLLFPCSIQMAPRHLWYASECRARRSQRPVGPPRSRLRASSVATSATASSSQDGADQGCRAMPLRRCQDPAAVAGAPSDGLVLVLLVLLVSCL